MEKNMKIVVLHGQNHMGSTYRITKLLLNELAKKTDSVLEFQMNNVKPCVGCFSCFIKDETLCPQYSVVGPIIQAIEQADIIIVESPTYCLEMTGQLKTFFDHMAYRWITHRPHASMKNKIGVAISTTAGIGAKGTAKSIARQMYYWGIAKTYRISFTVSSMSWNEIKAEKKSTIEKAIQKNSKKIMRKIRKVKPGIKSRLMFNMMKSAQKGNQWNPVDRKHWEENGWL